MLKSRKGEWLFFFIPSILALGVVILYPLIYMIVMSSYSYSLFDLEPTFVGLRNYVNALSQDEFIHSFLVTTYYIVIAIPLEIIIGFIIALLFYQNLKGFKILRTLIVAPLMTMAVITALSWRYIYHSDYGLIKYLASFIGLTPPMWFSHPVTAIISLAILDIWQVTPFAILVFLAGLQSIPQSLFEVASIDGASYLSTVRYVVIPLLKPIFLLILLLRVIDGYKLFDYVFMLTGGGPGNSTESIAYFTYRWAFENVEIGYGSTLGVLALVLSLSVGIFLIRQVVKSA